ncbi:MAG TPA: Tat pathway signal protein [Bacteroidetes bacterium]|nr:Tat pathway signal protein [Bacteroidota bacterium]
MDSGTIQDISKSNKLKTEFNIDTLQFKTFKYFWDLGKNKHYQIPDRYPQKTFYSISATGFGLAAYIIGIERKYITRDEGTERVLNTLISIKNLVQNDSITASGYKGFFYHFLDLKEAKRYKKVELSSVDTGLLLAGILLAQSYFDSNVEKEKRIRSLADEIYRKVDWTWMYDKEKNLLSMGWKPETGFLKHYWQGYNEALFLYILALGSPTHSIPEESYDNWLKTYSWKEFMGYKMINFSPLFGHQFSQAFIDFRGIGDKFVEKHNIDYFENSKRATLSQIKYAENNPNKFKGYSKNLWGFTACDGPNDTIVFDQKIYFYKYRARGVSASEIVDDGTIAPYASGASLPFTPTESYKTMEKIWETYNDKIIGEYGFKDAFNLSYTYGKGNEEGWYDNDYIGIDQGILLMQIENYRTELIWKILKKNKYVISGLKKAKFKGGWLKKL